MSAATTAVAAQTVPGGKLVAGRWGTDDRRVPVTDPDDGSVVGMVCASTVDDVGNAIEAGRRALMTPWPVWARCAALRDAAQRVLADRQRLVHLISGEGVKTVTEADREIDRCAETLRLTAEAAEALEGQTLPFAASPRMPSTLGWFRREAVGVIAAITPFNDPLNLVAHKVGPALLGGNSVVVKPSENTPLTALALAQLLLESGVPAARLSVIPGGVEVGRALVAHPDVALVSFTGGPRVAARIAAEAGPKKLLTELGANNATIVAADADIDSAARQIVDGAFGVAGQNCLSVQRVYVERSVHDELVTRTVEHTDQLQTGPKRDPLTDIGPLIDLRAAQRVEQWVTQAVDAGARLQTGGRRIGNTYLPTVLTDVPPDCQILTDEVFGPVVSIVAVDDIDEAVTSANDCHLALQAGIFTTSIDTAMSVAERLIVGAVVVNGTSDQRLDAMPFGGFKGSGIGREGVRYALEAMTEPKSTIINITR
ncbi:aldehyde dehydrogenase family protein [Williamsia sp. CHRR-6]|uniref:aldehyde dehydrogenase family protein n=1 Tax=Williamsia sp. CHRR-6 TaxID=2835871 RepID=UPI001BD9C239|nr:aldehyde dehydrogenase family protein [Williamsia sp. CHRR-6]MBT0566810.1 aldehyde dehydrogenase family protein [Williamsia sp. CHRR-6]